MLIKARNLLSRQLELSQHQAEELNRINLLADSALDLTKAGYWHVPLDGSAPADIVETCAMPLGTVKNELTRLRKRGLVEYTGEIDPRTKAKEVRLTEDGLAVTGVIPL